eukprot:4159817-Pleurochrysis_carterae.AAC.1
MQAFKDSHKAVADDLRYLKYERRARRKAQQQRDQALSPARELTAANIKAEERAAAAEKQADKDEARATAAVAARNKYYDKVRGLEAEVAQETTLRRQAEKKLEVVNSEADSASEAATAATVALEALDRNYKERIAELEELLDFQEQEFNEATAEASKRERDAKAALRAKSAPKEHAWEALSDGVKRWARKMDVDYLTNMLLEREWRA